MSWQKIARGVAGLVVLVVLVLVVRNWWGDFRATKPSDVTTSTVDATATPPGKKGSGAPTPASISRRLVAIDGLNFRKSPDPTAEAIRGLKKGDRLVVLAREGDWYKVRTEDGVTGWVSANTQYTRPDK